MRRMDKAKNHSGTVDTLHLSACDPSGCKHEARRSQGRTDNCGTKCLCKCVFQRFPGTCGGGAITGSKVGVATSKLRASIRPSLHTIVEVGGASIMREQLSGSVAQQTAGAHIVLRRQPRRPTPPKPPRHSTPVYYVRMCIVKAYVYSSESEGVGKVSEFPQRCASWSRRYKSKLNGWYDLRECRVVDVRFSSKRCEWKRCVRGADSQAYPNGRRSDSHTVSQPCCLPRAERSWSRLVRQTRVCARRQTQAARQLRMHTNDQQCPIILTRVALSASPGGTRQRRACAETVPSRTEPRARLHKSRFTWSVRTRTRPQETLAGRTEYLLVSSAVCRASNMFSYKDGGES